MGRPRTATAVLELNGSFDKNPQRRRKHEPKPSGPLGDPPKRLDTTERKMWRELEGMAPDKVLANSDRWLVEIVCRLMTRWVYKNRMPLNNGELAQLMQGLSRMGLTPADRSRIDLGSGEKETNAFTKFTGTPAAAAGSTARPN